MDNSHFALYVVRFPMKSLENSSLSLNPRYFDYISGGTPENEAQRVEMIVISSAGGVLIHIRIF